MLRQFVAAAAVASIIVAPGVAHADTNFTIGGTSHVIDTGQPSAPFDLSTFMGGIYNDGPTKAIQYPADIVGMPQSIDIGSDHLVSAIQATEGPKRAIGISQGAIVIAEAKRKLMELPADQRPTGLTFVAIADPTRPGHGLLAQLGYHNTDTPYDTTYITKEYDGFADWPDRFNIVAIVNVIAGIAYVHPFYGDPIPADATTTTTVNSAGGKDTDVLIHTAHLPMLQPLRDLGFNVDGLEAILKPIVDSAYSRNDPKPAVKPAPEKTPEPVKTVSEVKDEVKPQVDAKPVTEDAPVEKPHHNVQASDAAHEVQTEVKADKGDKADAKPSDSKPVEKPETVKPETTTEADKPADASDDKGTSTDKGTDAS